MRAECTFFLSSHGTFTKIKYILNYKSHFNKFKRMEIIQSMLLDYIEIKLEINNRKLAKVIKYLEIIHTLLNNTWLKEKYK